MSNVGYGKISVCMATFNGEKFVREQINSILPQLSEFDELIISDDSSNDSTIEIINSIADPRIKLLSNQSFRSPIFNFENALKNASGDIIFLSDQDDIWKPDKIQIMAPLVPRHHLVLSDCTFINDGGTIIASSYFLMIQARPGFWRNLFRTSPYMGCCLGFSKQLLKIALPFPKRIPMHDLWIGIIGEIYFRPIFVRQSLIYYRRHVENASRTGLKSKNSLVKKIGFRIQIILPAVLRKYGRSY